jgi:hypothetical protein
LGLVFLKNQSLWLGFLGIQSMELCSAFSDHEAESIEGNEINMPVKP